MNAITPTQSNVQAALAAFINQVLPGFPGALPAVFSGTIAGTVLTVSALEMGTILSNAPLLGAAPGTTIVAPVPGFSNKWTVSVSQTISNQTPMATGVSVVAGQPNRVAESVNPWFAVMTPIRFERLATNVDTPQDVRFTASIAGTVMTVASVSIGAGELEAGLTVSGTGVTAGTVVLNQLTGTPGGAGTYTITPSQTVSSGVMGAGFNSLVQSAKVTVQIDFHSSDTTAGDFAQTVSTALRDPYGVNFFAQLGGALAGVVPLYADDPKQIPFVNDQDQYEWRWVLEACFEVDQLIEVPLQFADSLDLTLISVTPQIAETGGNELLEYGGVELREPTN